MSSQRSAICRSVAELGQAEKTSEMFVQEFKKGKRRSFPRHPYLVCLKDAEVVIFDKRTSPPRFVLPLDNCSAVASEQTFKGKMEHLITLTIKDGTQFLLKMQPTGVADAREMRDAWTRIFLAYSENFKHFMKHRIPGTKDAPVARVQISGIPADCQGCISTVRAVLLHVRGVVNVECDPDDMVFEIFGDTMSVNPNFLLDAVESAGFKCNLVGYRVR
eukprot:gnl/Dysnectes_brevis/834_a919_2682.p1 GENE.gnl/Dysnectes_brevis/834_a919_2682~~gnl/Dysnectes_brevis/834_a919_2682.p1  ORF type:complete len:218 (-),score=55.93 gnl/Dysnectes_brevis/834_a919_2682:416-1069(-)